MEFSNNHWSQISQIMRNMTLATCHSGMVIPMQHVLVPEKTQRDLLGYKSSSKSQVCRILKAPKT